MKLRKLLTLFVLSTGAFFVLSNQHVKADGTFCLSTGNWCNQDCWAAYYASNSPTSLAELERCFASCATNQYACYSAFAWQSWLLEFDNNITDDFFLIDNGPDPICGNYPEMLVGCGNLPTAEEIEVCTLMLMQEQAKFGCP